MDTPPHSFVVKTVEASGPLIKVTDMDPANQPLPFTTSAKVRGYELNFIMYSMKAPGIINKFFVPYTSNLPIYLDSIFFKNLK